MAHGYNIMRNIHGAHQSDINQSGPFQAEDAVCVPSPGGGGQRAQYHSRIHTRIGV